MEGPAVTPVSHAQAARAKGGSGPALSLSLLFLGLVLIVNPPFSALSFLRTVCGPAVSPGKCCLSDAGASVPLDLHWVPGVAALSPLPGQPWTAGLWLLSIVKCAVMPPAPSLPAVPGSPSCSAWGKAVRIPG